MNIIPSTQTRTRDFAGDIFSVILKDRIVFLEGEITPALATVINAQLLYLKGQSEQPIQLYINSPGGDISAGLSVYDTIMHIGCPVYTIASGLCASMAAVILSGGSKRYALKHSDIIIHQPSCLGMHGQETDIRISAEQISKKRRILTELLAENCKKPFEKVAIDTERDYYLSAEEALEYGLIDEVLS